jgi:hypothetical protein
MQRSRWDRWETTPRLRFLSPEPVCWKTRGGIEITGLLVPRPVEAFNVSTAYLFRKMAANEGLPTILWDEVDSDATVHNSPKYYSDGEEYDGSIFFDTKK